MKELLGYRTVNEELIYVTDRNDVSLREGDIIRECVIGQSVWDGEGVIVECPLGLVVVGSTKLNGQYSIPEITDRYNVISLKPGLVKLVENNESIFLRHYEKDGDYYCPIHLTTYDGKFYGWNNIEKIGSVYDIEEAFKLYEKGV